MIVLVIVVMNERDNAATIFLYEYIVNIDFIELYCMLVLLDGGFLVEFMILLSILFFLLVILLVVCVFDFYAVVVKVELNGFVLCFVLVYSFGFVVVGV